MATCTFALPALQTPTMMSLKPLHFNSAPIISHPGLFSIVSDFLLQDASRPVPKSCIFSSQIFSLDRRSEGLSGLIRGNHPCEARAWMEEENACLALG